MDKQLVMAGVLILFNAATLYLLAYVLRRVDLKSAMQEKSAGDAADTKAPDSYSRVAGMLGAALMVTLFWACSNLVIYNSFVAAESVKSTIDAVGSFLLYGSALFLPYAANQIRAIFPGQKS